MLMIDDEAKVFEYNRETICDYWIGEGKGFQLLFIWSKSSEMLYESPKLSKSIHERI